MNPDNPDENPFLKPATFTKLVSPKPAARGGGQVVILERIEPGVIPDYEVYGKVTCWYCNDWCWLGNNTFDPVSSGEVAPMCRQCGARLLPQDGRPVGNISDT